MTSRKACGERKEINQFKDLAFTPTALNSRAQRRVAHAGLLVTHTAEPQRGSTINQHSIWQLQRKISAVYVNEFTGCHTSQGFGFNSWAMAAAKRSLPRSVSRHRTAGSWGNRNVLAASPRRIAAGISSWDISKASPSPIALIKASLSVQKLKNKRILRQPCANANSACSSGPITLLMSRSRWRGLLRSSTSTPSRPAGASAIKPWAPLWLTLKLTGTAAPFHTA